MPENPAPARSLLNFARILTLQVGGWSALVTDPQQIGQAEVDLSDEIEAFGEAVDRVDAGRDKGKLAVRLQEHPQKIALVSGVGGWTAQDWREADELRSRFRRQGALVWLLTPAAANAMTNYAPNLASFVGGNIHSVAPDPGLLTEEQRAERLAALRTHYGLADDQVVEQAQAGILAWEPQMAEWLVLLGRGDLIP